MGFIEESARDTFRRVLREVKAHEDMAESELRPGFDPRQHKEYLAEAAQGRKSEQYRKALHHHGFAWTPRWKLPPLDGRPHQEGMWRHKVIGGFYPSDLTTLFPGGPEQFDRWCREQKMLKSARTPPKDERRKILAAR